MNYVHSIGAVVLLVVYLAVILSPLCQYQVTPTYDPKELPRVQRNMLLALVAYLILNFCWYLYWR